MSKEFVVRSTIVTLMAICFSVPRVIAVGTEAGTVISNQATVTFKVGTVSGITQASTDPTGSDPDGKTLVTVAQLINVDVELQTTTPVQVKPNDKNQGLTFKVTNTGNGEDTIDLTFISTALSGDDFDPSEVNIFFDDPTSNDGQFGQDDLDAGNLYVRGTNDPVLERDGSVIVHVVNDIPSTGLSDGDRGDSKLTAASKTKTGAPGDNAPGAGVGGVDACVGTTGGTDEATGSYVVVNIVIVVNKTAEIEDLFNPGNFSTTNKPLPGAKIRYTITVEVQGDASVTAEGVTFTDDIPADTAYITDSVTVNTVAKGDLGTDGDNVVVSGGTITVTLGDLTSSDPIQNITFDVKIN